jgi:lipoate-protein ligase A
VALNIQVIENVQTVGHDLTAHELELAEKLYREKYCTDSWNFNGKAAD